MTGRRLPAYASAPPHARTSASAPASSGRNSTRAFMSRISWDLHPLNPRCAPVRRRKGLGPVRVLLSDLSIPHLKDKHALVGISITVVEVGLQHPVVPASRHAARLHFREGGKPAIDLAAVLPTSDPFAG